LYFLPTVNFINLVFNNLNFIAINFSAQQLYILAIQIVEFFLTFPTMHTGYCTVHHQTLGLSNGDRLNSYEFLQYIEVNFRIKKIELMQFNVISGSYYIR
jgi:hypothetical protein